jgi:hypothetical protein
MSRLAEALFSLRRPRGGFRRQRRHQGSRRGAARNAVASRGAGARLQTGRRVAYMMGADPIAADSGGACVIPV